MKISCQQEQLAKGLNAVSKAVASRTTTLPILTHVLLATDAGRLKIAATNLELGMTCWIDTEVEAEGAITLPARTLADLVALLPQGKVSLSLEASNQTVNISSGRSNAHIKGIDAQEFPIIPPFDKSQLVAQIDTAVLRKMVARVGFAAATDESRPMLTGVMLKLSEQNISMVATDGFRLSRYTAVLQTPATQAKDFLVPAKAIAEVARVVSDQEGVVSLSITPTNGQVLFHTNNVDIVAQLIDQKYPDVDNIIPKRFDTRTTLSSADFLKGCKQASIFARDSQDTIKVSINPPSSSDSIGKVLVAAKADETGDNQSDLEAHVEGKEIEMGFNVRFLIDLLGAIDTPQILMETTAPKNPALFRLPNDESFLHVVMPMNLPKG